MRVRLADVLSRKVDPIEPGPRGRLLFVGPFNGGLGGVERLTRIFADWVEESGYSATMVFENADLPVGPFTVRSTERVQAVPGTAWSSRLADAAWDFVYIIPRGLGHRRWIPRLTGVHGRRVMLDLDPKRKYIELADVLHCEAPRAAELPVPHVVAMPDPRSTIAPVEHDADAGALDAYLTVFTPYGDVKGFREIPAFLDASDRRLVWCYDPVTFEHRKRRMGRTVRDHVAAVAHPRLEPVEAPSQQVIYSYYQRCLGYVCFSESETLGFSMLDAVALGRPLCARRTGVCRAIPDFVETEDFARPEFRKYDLPDTPGYEGLFTELERQRSAGATK